MIERLKSRKFWTAMITNIAGIVTLIWGAQTGEQFTLIAGCVLSIAATLGYVYVEGSIDRDK
jgi:inner membrane protein involved in colicin E2 resistance